MLAGGKEEESDGENRKAYLQEKKQSCFSVIVNV